MMPAACLFVVEERVWRRMRMDGMWLGGLSGKYTATASESGRSSLERDRWFEFQTKENGATPRVHQWIRCGEWVIDWRCCGRKRRTARRAEESGAATTEGERVVSRAERPRGREAEAEAESKTGTPRHLAPEGERCTEPVSLAWPGRA